MSKKTGLIRCIAIAGAAWLSGASGALAAEQWGASTVKAVYPMSNGDFVIQLVSSPPLCPATSEPKYLWVSVGQNNVTTDGVKAMLASALAAMAMDKTIHVAFSDSTPYCYVNRFVVIN
jgi:hypothetical protein